MVESSGLLNRRRVKSSTGGSNPPLSASIFFSSLRAELVQRSSLCTSVAIEFLLRPQRFSASGRLATRQRMDADRTVQALGVPEQRPTGCRHLADDATVPRASSVEKAMNCGVRTQPRATRQPWLNASIYRRSPPSGVHRRGTRAVRVLRHQRGLVLRPRGRGRRGPHSPGND